MTTIILDLTTKEIMKQAYTTRIIRKIREKIILVYLFLQRNVLCTAHKSHFDKMLNVSVTA